MPNPEEKKLVDRVIEKIARQEPHEFDRNHKERWRIYLETLIRILGVAGLAHTCSHFASQSSGYALG